MLTIAPAGRSMPASGSNGQSASAREKVAVFINPGSGSAEMARALLEQDERVALRALQPAELREALLDIVGQGAERVVVSGGDGTLSLAASCLAGSETALAVLPGGTLNHFAQRVGVPVDYAEALEVALAGHVQHVGLGCVNGQHFINTSSAGTYVSFVRTREYLERRMGYGLASFLAGVRRFVRLRSSALMLDGTKIRTPQLYVGVDERELRYPHLGSNVEDGAEGLHVFAALSRGRLESMLIAMKSVLRGAQVVEEAKELENRLLQEFTVDYPRKRNYLQIAIDGELIRVQTPLRYRYMPNALRVVVPDVEQGAA